MPKQEPKEQLKQEEKPVPIVEVPDNFEPWTVDIRQRCGDVVNLGDILTIQNELKEQGRKLVHLYVRDPQEESVKKVTKDIEITVA